MDIDLAKNIIAAFDRFTYRDFFIKLLENEYGTANIISVPNSSLIKHRYENYLNLNNKFYAFEF